MTSPVLTDPDMRAEGVRRLISQAGQDGAVALAPLAGMDLCALGGPRHAVFPDALASTWLRMKPGERDKFIGHTTTRLTRDSLLIPDARSSAQPGYSMSPELGIVIAARCRPLFAVVGAVPGAVLPTVSMFALGQDPDAHLLVSETLFKLPGADGGKHPKVAGTRILGCVYSYHLLRADCAATALTEWALVPTDKRRPWSREPGRILTRYQSADASHRIGYQLTVHGDGTTAQVTGGDPADPAAPRTCARDELQAVLAQLLAREYP